MMGPAELLEKNFPFTPTDGQRKLFAALEIFILDKPGSGRDTFLLKGFAGTGKTSVITTMVKSLRYFNLKSLLLAPTGRAAKVMAGYANRKAFTIHKVIFKQVEDPNSGRVYFRRQKNTGKNTIFIVDEASMINNASDNMNGNGLLHELVEFVFQVKDSGNKLVLIGDTAQLPPVHQEMSPALDIISLEREYRLKVSPILLTEVVRQEQRSGILENATTLRGNISQKNIDFKFQTKSYKDIFRMNGDKLEDGMRYAYNKFGEENTCIVCRSNRSATMYNQYIRRNIKFYDSEIDAGDLIMVVRNNYTWLEPDSVAGFLANGEFLEIRKVKNVEEMHGFRFADLSLQLLDYPDEPAFEAKVHLNTLHSYTPNLDQEDLNKLYESVLKDYEDVKDKRQQLEYLRKDPYLNALQIKFAYALTCHKAQGGQWNAVFVDLGFMTQEHKNQEFLRWLYTAVTRASDELFLMNFPDEFFVG